MAYFELMLEFGRAVEINEFMDQLEARLERERRHGKVILEMDETNWGWHTPAGRIRRDRRAEYLTTYAGRDLSKAKVLEVGCGTGTFTGDFAKVFSDLTCIDISDTLLEKARARFPKVQFVNGDIHRTKFAGETFDIIVGCSVLHHLDWRLALKEMRRLLKPGGELRFCEPNLLNPQIFLQKNWPWLKKRMGDSPDEYAFSPAEIMDALKSAGFSEVSAAPFEFLHPATPPRLIGTVVRLENILHKTFLKQIGGSIKIAARK